MSKKIGCPAVIRVMTSQNCRCLGGRMREGACVPPRGKLIVRKKLYHRKSFTRSDGTHVKASDIKGSYHVIKDIGAPGRGEKKIKISAKGALTKYGYSTSSSSHERHKALDKSVKAYGSAKVWRRLHAMVGFRKRTNGNREIFEADRNYVKRKYNPDLSRKKKSRSRKK